MRLPDRLRQHCLTSSKANGVPSKTRTQRRVKAAAALVLATAPTVAAAVERLERAEVELAAAGDRLRWLIKHGAVAVAFAPPGGSYSDRNDYERRARVANARLDQAPSQWGDVLREIGTANTAAWGEALTALEADPDAPLD